MYSMLNIGNLVHSILVKDCLHSNVSFKDEAKFGLLRNAAMKVQYFASFSIYRDATDYESLNVVIIDLYVGRRAPHRENFCWSNHTLHTWNGIETRTRGKSTAVTDSPGRTG